MDFRTHDDERESLERQIYGVSNIIYIIIRNPCVRDCKVVGLTTTHAVSNYDYYRFEFEFR